MPDHTHRPDHLIVIADHMCGAHVTDSEDIFWWLPIIGPGASFLAYVLARHARHTETTWNIDDLAHTVGLGGSHSNLWQRIDRLDRFGLLTFVSTDVATIRLELPALNQALLARLPAHLAATYRELNVA